VTVKRLSIALPGSPGLNSKSVLGGPGLVLRRLPPCWPRPAIYCLIRGRGIGSGLLASRGFGGCVAVLGVGRIVCGSGVLGDSSLVVA